MLQEARTLLNQALALEVRARQLPRGQTAQLCMAIDEALPYPPIAQLLKELAQQFSALELTLLNGTAAEVTRDVLSQRAALAFQFERGPVDAQFAQRYVAGVPQMVYVARDHDLAKQTGITRADLARHRQLVMHIEGVENLVISPRLWRSENFYVLADMLADGIGWGIFPYNIAQAPDIQSRIAP